MTTTEPIAAEPVTIPAYGVGETRTVLAQRGWHDRIRRIADTGATQYGPKFSRSVNDQLTDMHDCCRNGYTSVAYDHLVAAERRAGMFAVNL